MPPASILPYEEILLPYSVLPSILPLALIIPVTYSPVGSQTTTLLVPLIVTLALPFNAAVILVLPYVIAVAVVADIPVN